MSQLYILHLNYGILNVQVLFAYHRWIIMQGWFVVQLFNWLQLFPLITNIVKVAEQIKKDLLKMGVDGSASFIDFQLFHFPTRIIPEHGVFGNCLYGKWNLDAFGPMSKEIF